MRKLNFYPSLFFVFLFLTISSRNVCRETHPLYLSTQLISLWFVYSLFHLVFYDSKNISTSFYLIQYLYIYMYVKTFSTSCITNTIYIWRNENWLYVNMTFLELSYVMYVNLDSRCARLHVITYCCTKTFE